MRTLLILLFTVASLFADVTFEDINLGDKKIFIQQGSYKVLQFSGIISKVKIKDNVNIDVSFEKSVDKPLQAIKIFAKEVGKTSLFITFTNGTSQQLECYVTKDLGTVIELSKIISPNVEIEQTKGKVVLRGSITSMKHREKIIDMLVKIGLDEEKDIINLTTIENPNKMIRVKLYVAEINNAQGKEIKNKWYYNYQNYTTSYGDPKVISSNTGKLAGYTPQIAEAVEGAVTLTGGLTAAANLLAGGFNVGLVLNYLQTQGVAKILDETNLITVENKDAKFHAGGTIYLKLQTTTKEGVPTTEVKPLKYGLELEVKAKEIVDHDFVNLEILTKSTKIDWANTVDGIPSFSDKSVNTYVVAKNKSTIVLGGLINSNDAKNYEKIPLLGDLPIIGRIFRSEAFTSGQSELVFFITPEVVDAKTNNQHAELVDKKRDLRDIIKSNEKYTKEKQEKLENNKEVKKIEKVAPVKEQNKQKTNQELHEERVKAILG